MLTLVERLDDLEKRITAIEKMLLMKTGGNKDNEENRFIKIILKLTNAIEEQTGTNLFDVRKELGIARPADRLKKKNENPK